MIRIFILISRYRHTYVDVESHPVPSIGHEKEKGHIFDKRLLSEGENNEMKA